MQKLRTASWARCRPAAGTAMATKDDRQTPRSEPLLWVPDAIEWALGRGGTWRRKVRGLRLVNRSLRNPSRHLTPPRRKARLRIVRCGAGPMSSG